MSWISLLLQFVSLRKSLHESKALVEAAQTMAARGKRFLISFAGIFFAAIFLFSGFVVAVIELGLQIEQGGTLHYSGLMVSASIFFGLGILIVVVSLLIGSSHFEPVQQHVSSSSPREDRIKDLLEEFLVTFLSRLSTKESGTSTKKQD